MKKYKNPLLQFQSHIPKRGELQTRQLRGRKDTREILWLMESRQGRNLIELGRKVLGLPTTGILPAGASFAHLDDVTNYPKISEYPKFNPKTLREIIRQILKVRNLSTRFWKSVEALLVFGKPLQELSSAIEASIVIRNMEKLKKELWIRVYPEATFKDDIRAYWHRVVILQQQLKASVHKHKWRIHQTKAQLPVEEMAVYVEVYHDTTLEDLNNQRFKKELVNTFTKAGISRHPFRRLDYKKAIRLLELDMQKGSDWDKAEELYGDEKRRNAVKKLRQRSRKI